MFPIFPWNPSPAFLLLAGDFLQQPEGQGEQPGPGIHVQDHSDAILSSSEPHPSSARFSHLMQLSLPRPVPPPEISPCFECLPRDTQLKTPGNNRKEGREKKERKKHRPHLMEPSAGGSDPSIMRPCPPGEPRRPDHNIRGHQPTGQAGKEPPSARAWGLATTAQGSGPWGFSTPQATGPQATPDMAPPSTLRTPLKDRPWVSFQGLST